MSFIWGASFILIKKSLLAFSAYQSGALRIAFASVFFLPFAIKRLKKFSKSNIKSILISGFIGNLFPAFMFAYGELTISSSLASMLNSTTPIFVLVVGLVLYKTTANWQNIVGLLIGFVGTLGLVIKDPTSITSGWNFGALVILGATFFYGINTNEIKYKLKDLDGFTIASLSFLIIGPSAFLFFLTTDISAAINSPFFWTSTAALGVLSFFGSFIAVILFNTLIQYTNPVFTASVTYFIPIFAIFWGILDGDNITVIQIISIIFVLGGVSLINKKTAPKKLSVNK